MKCRNPECNADVNPGALFCGKCGMPVLARCTRCGTEIPLKKTAKCCPKCGTMLSAMSSESESSGPAETPDPVPAVKPAPESFPERPANCPRCNTPLPGKKNAKCCSKCGMMISDMLKIPAAPDEGGSAETGPSAGGSSVSGTTRPEFCTECGTPIPAKKNVKCCPKCGMMIVNMKKPPVDSGTVVEPHIVPEETTYCTECGAPLHPGDLFCGNCRTPVSGSAAGKGPVKKPDEKKLEEKKPLPITASKNPAKKAVIILLVIGLCLLWTGIGGKLILGQVRSGVYHALEVQGADILDRYAGGVVENMLIAAIRNDANGFIDSFYNLISIVSSLNSGSNSMDSLTGALASGMVRQYLPELRRQLQEQMGPIWIVLYVASCWLVFLIAGAVITIGAIAAWVVFKCEAKDIKEQKMIPALIVGGVWIVLVTVITIIMMCMQI